MSRQAKEDPSLRSTGQVAVMLACAIMAVRVAILGGLVGGPDLFRALLLPMAVMVATLLLTAWWTFRKSSGSGVGTQEMPLRNPFHLKRAVGWGLALATVLLVSAAARAWFGDRGLLVAAGLSGLADVDPITLAVSSQLHSTQLPVQTAVAAIVVAIAANTLAKAGLAWISGGRAFGLRLTAMLVISLAAALAMLAF